MKKHPAPDLPPTAQQVADHVQRRQQEQDAEKQDRPNIWRTRSLSSPLGSGPGAGTLEDVLDVGPSQEDQRADALTMGQLRAIATRAKLRPIEAVCFRVMQQGGGPVDVRRETYCSKTQASWAWKRTTQKLSAAIGKTTMPHVGRPKVPSSVQLERRRKYLAKKRQELFDAGRCQYCRRPRESKAIKTCNACRDREKQQYRDRQRAGLCVTCGLERGDCTSNVLCQICCDIQKDREKAHNPRAHQLLYDLAKDIPAVYQRAESWLHDKALEENRKRDAS